MYNNGKALEYEWLLNTLVSKYKQLVSEGNWKIKDDEPNMVAMIQKLESKNQELTKALNNLAEKTSQAFTAQNSQSNGSRNQGKGGKSRDTWGNSSKSWKSIAPKEGEPTTKTNSAGRVFEWYPWYKLWVATHKPENCYRKNKSSNENDTKPSLQMNVINTNELSYLPIHPWLGVAFHEEEALSELADPLSEPVSVQNNISSNASCDESEEKEIKTIPWASILEFSS